MAKVTNWNRIKGNCFNEKALRQVFSGQNAMLVMNAIEPGFPPFPHSHPHEQILMILEGECDVTVGEEIVHMGPNDMVCIPPNVPHDLAVTGNKRVVNLDIFSPIREDYL